MTLWLARHARPLVERGICYGSSDLDVDAGHNLEVAQAVARMLPPRVQLVSSPLRRCRLLAEAIVQLRGDLALRLDERLRELDFGQWEGRRWCDIQEHEYAAWLQDFQHHAPGGGESVAQLLARVQQLRAERRGPAAWITHAGVIRAVQVLGRGTTRLRSAGDWPAGGPGFGEWLELPA